MYYEMTERAGKFRKGYLDHPKNISTVTCLVHGPVYSSYEFEVLRDSDFKYSNIRPTKDRGHEPSYKKNSNRHQYNNPIINHKFDEIILQDNNKVNFETDENDWYDIDNMSIDEKKEWSKRVFESELENICDIEIHNGTTCMHRK